MVRHLSRFAIVALLLFCVSRTSNAQTFWEATSGPKINQGAVEYLIATPSGHLFAAVFGGGAYRSTDDGDSWSFLRSAPVNILSLAMDSAGVLYAGVRPTGLDPMGVYRSDDEGQTWSWIGPKGETINWITITPAGKIYAASQSGGVYSFHPFDTSWTELNFGHTSSNITSFVTTRHGIFLIGTTVGVMGYYVDSMDAWHLASQGLMTASITTLMVAPTGALYAGSREHNVYRSDDDGATWNTIGTNLPADFGPVTTLFLDDSGRILAGSSTKGVYRTSDGGNYWSAINGGMDRGVYCITKNSRGRLFAGTIVGVYRSVVGTAGVGRVGAHTPFRLEQNTPNPFTSVTRIHFTIPDPGFTTLAMYDLSGNIVATLLNKYMDAGEEEVTFDRGMLPAGIYFYRLSVGGKIRCNSLVAAP